MKMVRLFKFEKERLEQLRWLDNGYKIKVGITTFEAMSVDTPEDIEKKLLNYTHHYEYEQSGLKLNDIEKMVKMNKVIYDHSVDQRDYKWKGNKSLKKVTLSEMPDYLSENYKKYKEWLEI